MSGPNPGNIGAPAAGVLMRATGASNVAAHVYGYGSYNRDTGARLVERAKQSSAKLTE